MTGARDRPPLEVEGVTVAFGPRTALVDATVSVEAGEVVGLAGPNGSGKTTLLRAALGLVPLERGIVRLSGEDVGRLDIRERARRVAWVPQTEAPQDNVPAFDYVLFGRYAHLAPFEGERAEDRHHAEAALKAVDLWGRRGSGILELSGGERQRVLLARALAQEAPLLLLDEPTAHLDVGHQLDLLDRVRALAHRHGTAVVVALHDLNLAARYVERVLVLDHGRIVNDGSPSEILSPELLREVWGVDAELRVDPRSGQPYLIPRLPSAPRRVRGPERGPVHVIGGGGTATSLLARLVRSGWRVTAGVLPLFDTDTETARELGIPAEVGVPFSAISPESRAGLERLLTEARAVVVAPIPVGPANLANLEELVARTARRTPVLLLEPKGWEGRDFTGGAASRVREQLLEAGAKSVASEDAVLAELELVAAPPAVGRGFPSAVAESGDR